MAGSNANFNATTRSFTQIMTPMVMQATGTTTFADLPQSGYLAAIDLIFTGTATADGTTGGANILTYPAPNFGLVKKIQLRTNQGADIWNTSAWGAYQYDRTLRSDFDPRTVPANTFPFTPDPSDAYWDPLPSNIAASGSTDFAFPVRLQLTWGEMLQAGLILLQNPGVRFTMSIDWGSATDLFTAATAAQVTLSNVSVTPYLQLFQVPQEDTNQPDLSLAKTVLEDILPITGTGVFNYQPPRGNTYTRLIQEFVNGPTTGYLPMGYEAGSSATYVTLFQAIYSQTQNIMNTPVLNKLFEQRRLYGGSLPVGCYVHEFSLGNGVPEFPNGRDNVDTSQITDFNINTTLAGSSPTAGAFVRTVKEQLVVEQS